MNKIINVIFNSLLLFCGTVILYGQPADIMTTPGKVVLFSDRTLYVAGEQILFSATYLPAQNTQTIDSSRVLYCEIITPSGGRITGNKYLMENYSASGFLKIPGDITTGMYYLRAYTRYMRNWGPSVYHYSLVKIVNANKGEVRAADDVSSSSSANQYLVDETAENNTSISISADKSQYNPGERVSLSIDCRDNTQLSSGKFSISVVPDFSVNTNSLTLPENGPVQKKAIYYPENHGLSITGKLTDNKSGELMTDARVNLSIIGNGRDFMAVQTDPSGRFFFSLPDLTGNRDIFLCPETSGTKEPKILVDNDFCTIPYYIPTGAFNLTDSERETAYNLAINRQLEPYFRNDTLPLSGSDTDDTRAFYGKPSEILYIDNYVQLPTLEEYFNSLPTLVKVRKRQGEKYFKVLGTQNGLNEYDPLILVDLVAIGDPERVLAIPPANVTRIEVVNMLYVKGEQTYGGVINIITKLGDFAGLDLPSSGIFINYGFLADNTAYHTLYQPDYHSPDTRNTIFWEPNFVLSKTSSAKISFSSSHIPGRYLIILSGINLKGESISHSSAFEVIQKQN